MKSLLAAGLCAAFAFATPAAAQDGSDEIAREMEQGLGQLLNDPAMPDRMAAMAVAMLTAIEAMPIGQMEAAIEGRPATEEEAVRLLGDEIDIDRDELARETRRAMVENRDQMQRSVRAMALMVPVIMATAQTMARTIEDAGIEDR